MLLLNIRLQNQQLLRKKRIRLRRVISLHSRSVDVGVDLRGARRGGAETAEASEEGVCVWESEDAGWAGPLGGGLGLGL